jgi:triacylglycerol esterase/lipase EstA (alpha/beta hydrolase family)
MHGCSHYAYLIAAMLMPFGLAQSRYVRGQAENKQDNRRVIVFVHGVLGNARESWTNLKSKTFFPDLLINDKTFDGWDVFVVDYPSRALGADQPRIHELAESLRLTFVAHGVLDHREIVFVCHSMGGLVTRSYLVKYREVAKKVRMLYFFATPTTGASIAKVAGRLTGSPQDLDMASLAGSSDLSNMLQTWLASPELRALPSFCAYETRDTLAARGSS